jgi:hypothetical protein
MSSLSALRQEHQERRIGPQLAELLERIVWTTAVTYPPAEYSDAGVWNRQALEDALQDWVEIRLLGRGDLTVMLGSARSLGSLKAALTTSFGQLLTNRRRRSSATNLYKRTLSLLRSDSQFATVGSARRPNDQLWTLAAEPHSDPSGLPTEELLKAAWELGDDELGTVRYGPYSLKSSPILRTPQLREFLVHLLSRATGSLTTANVFEVMRHRFNLAPLSRLELDERMGSDEPSLVVQVEQAEIARSVLARLGAERVNVLRQLHLADGDVEAAAAELGEGIEAVSQTIHEVMAMIAEYAETAEEAVAVYRRLTESLF